MVVDSSAIFAIVLQEAEANAFVALLMRQPDPLISAATLLELAAVGTRRLGGRFDARIDYTLAAFRPKVYPVTEAQAVIAQGAYRRFGLGTGHKAKLNFGDCFSYALAKETGRPLLFKGDDFPYTDIEAAA